MPFFPWWFLPPPSHTCWRLPAPTEWLVPESHRQPGKWNGLRFSVEHHWFIMQAWISYEMISILKDLYHRRRGINRDYDCKKNGKIFKKLLQVLSGLEVTFFSILWASLCAIYVRWLKGWQICTVHTLTCMWYIYIYTRMHIPMHVQNTLRTIHHTCYNKLRSYPQQQQ